MERLVGEIERSFAEVEERLQDPEVLGDQRQLADLGRRHRRLSEAHALATAWRDARQQIDDAGEMLESETDAETRSYLQGELEAARERCRSSRSRSGSRWSSATRPTTRT